MTKIYTKEIEYCNHCSNYCGRGDFEGTCIEAEKPILHKNRFKLPSWCPLPDKITEAIGIDLQGNKLNNTKQ